ncbi:MAG TPA: SAM-dependent methyltransferase, partial [Candidatus Desulfofervidus auxilii]|nr:SAM-dependent methyltransferase [Candidatus Desulfofervidus auxilii]
TLDEWIKRFESNIDKIKAMFGQKFINMWRLYLNGAAAGFKFGETNVYQILFLRNLEKLTPCYREDIYKNWE